LSVEKLTDFHGNTIDTFLHFEINLPKSPKKGDLIINELLPDPSPIIDLPEAEYVELFNLKNYSFDLEDCTLADENSVTTLPKIIIKEILFNPYPGGVDFVELYNASDHFFQLHDLIFKTSPSNTKSYSIQSNKNGIIYPHQYVALTIDTIQLKFDYPNSKELLQLFKMPPMNNTSGDLSLYQSEVLLDSVSYHEDQHFQLLSDYNGVSLERITFEGNGYDPNNWHSSSSVEGYATPGYKNSQYTNTMKTLNQFELNSPIISPDGDGFEDFLVLKYQMNNLGYILNGYIYNLAGIQVHHPFNNVLLSSNGNLKWDGLDSNGIKLSIGNYILLIEAFNETGKIIKRKIAFGITGIF
jgi:hypothetical protein